MKWYITILATLLFVLLAATTPAHAECVAQNPMTWGECIVGFFQGIGVGIDTLGKAIGEVKSALQWIAEHPNEAMIVIGLVAVFLGSIGIGGPIATAFGGLLVVFGVLRDPGFIQGLQNSPYLLLIVGALLVAAAAFRLARG